jgi:pentatricopeptide repeat protein
MHQASLKGNVPKAVEIFEELSANSEFVVETSTINTIIQAAANIGNVDSAEKWFKKIPEYGCNATVESYTGLISAYTKKRKVAKAEKVFKDMQVQEIEPDSVAYGALLSAFAGVGDLRSAEKYFSTMESARLKPNEIVYGAAAEQFRRQQPFAFLLPFSLIRCNSS